MERDRALRIGVTGHRPARLPPGSHEPLRLTVVRLFESIDAELTKAGRADAFAVVSALAEGADRLVAEAALPGWSLHVILPMPKAEYEHDFAPGGDPAHPSVHAFRSLCARAARVVEIPWPEPGPVPRGPGRERAYARLGTALVGEVDLLLAIWDGQPAAGPGGTALVVAEALRRGRPVVAIDPARPDAPRLLLAEHETGGGTGSPGQPVEDGAWAALLARTARG